MAKVQFYLTIKDGLEDLLGYIDDDLTEEMKTRMITCLNAAESFVQGSVGPDDGNFYQKNGVKNLYTVACNSYAATLFTYASIISVRRVNNVDDVCRSIIGQLRGKYDAKDDEVNNDGTEHQSDISNGVN